MLALTLIPVATFLAANLGQLVAVLVIVANALADMMVAALDPRVRLQ